MLIISAIFISTSASGQDSIIPKRFLTIAKTTTPPVMDGNLNDACWMSANLAENFVQYEPNIRQNPTASTEVRLCYDQDNIYVSAVLHDDPKLILKELCSRDQYYSANTDFFAISFDTYDDDLHGVRFIITPSGVQSDALMGRFEFGNGNVSNIDFKWDAVWDSKVKITDQGWQVEMRIPLFNLRFPKKENQIWGFQCSRLIKRLNETSVWQLIDPRIDGTVRQWGELNGLSNIKPSLRLSLSPYLAVGIDRIPNGLDNNNQQQYINGKNISGGLDVKYGINESVTLDATLIPDFSQVQSDQKILNLTPFEQRFEERRPFFTEGVDLFNLSNIFYSRRIGGTPIFFNSITDEVKDNEILISNPSNTQLYNATKISGTLKHKFRIGIFNAISAPSYAKIKNTATNITRKVQSSPLTNHNVTVVQKQLPHNSELSLINASTMRDGSIRDANVSALKLVLKDKKNNYQISLDHKISQIFNQKKPILGFVNYASLSKISGNLGWSIYNEVINDRWDPSDLGIFNGNNNVNSGVNFNYSQYVPNRYFQSSNWWAGIGANQRYIGFIQQGIYSNIGCNLSFKNQSSLNVWTYSQPLGTLDFFEPRVPGRRYRILPFYNNGVNYSSDNRRRVYYYLSAGSSIETRKNYYNLNFYIEPVWRISDKINASVAFQFLPIYNERGYITQTNGSDIIFGERQQNTIINSVQMSFNFTKKSNLRMSARHYSSSVLVNRFYLLNEDGSLGATNYSGDHDFGINFFNVDAVYQWEFQPGSYLSLIWKNAFNQYEQVENRNPYTYTKALSNLWNSPKENTITVKMIYFLNANKIKKLF